MRLPISHRFGRPEWAPSGVVLVSDVGVGEHADLGDLDLDAEALRMRPQLAVAIVLGDADEAQDAAQEAFGDPHGAPRPPSDFDRSVGVEREA